MFLRLGDIGKGVIKESVPIDDTMCRHAVSVRLKEGSVNPKAKAEGWVNCRITKSEST